MEGIWLLLYVWSARSRTLWLLNSWRGIHCRFFLHIQHEVSKKSAFLFTSAHSVGLDEVYGGSCDWRLHRRLQFLTAIVWMYGNKIIHILLLWHLSGWTINHKLPACRSLRVCILLWTLRVYVCACAGACVCTHACVFAWLEPIMLPSLRDTVFGSAYPQCDFCHHASQVFIILQ